MRFGFIIAVAVALATGCTWPKTFKTIDGAMLGTTFHIVAQTDAATTEIYDEVMRIDAEAKASMSIFDERSLISRINAGQTDTLDIHLLRNIAVAARVHRMSGGAYDITVKPLTDAYGFASKHKTQTPNIDSLVEIVGFDKMRVVGNRLIKSDPRVQLDLNSLAKGYTVDLVADMLERRGIANYIVEIGGEIRARGINAKSTAWRVGIDTPFEGNDTPGAHRQHVVHLDRRALATSGNYRRYYINERGEKIVHTINPKTGRTVASRLLSATVVANRCVEADALATMFMAMGAEQAIALADKMRDSVQVYFILDNETAMGEYEIFSTLKNE
jgi:thiamine biosynthesis lipoprotein